MKTCREEPDSRGSRRASRVTLRLTAGVPRAPRPRQVARSLVYALTGGGAEFLHHKREYHRRRAGAETAVLQAAGAGVGTPGFVANRCPACGGAATAERFSSPIGFQFAVCAGDGAVYMDPVPTDETLGRLYNDAAYSFHWLGDAPPTASRVVASHGADLEALLRMLGTARGDGARGRLLDVGCATGGFLLSAAAAGFAVEGVDVNDRAAAAARAAGLTVTTGRLEDLGGPPRFAVITALQLLEHVVHPADFLRAVHGLLEPGGVLYLDTPNIDSASFAFLGRHHVHVSSFGHVSLFNRAALDALARRCGFELVAHELCGGRDLALHDAVTFRLSRSRFVHRMSFYSPRLYHLCNLVEELSCGVLPALVLPPGHDSYQRALLRRAA